MHLQDKRGLYPIHVACMNTHDEGPDIVETLLEMDSLAARRVDRLGQVSKKSVFRTLPNFTDDVFSG